MNIQQLSLGTLGTNGYIIYQGNEAILIDPGGDADIIIQWFTDHKVTPVAILLTHAHFDHIGALDQIRDYYHVPVYLHKSELSWLEDPARNSSSLFPVPDIRCRPADYPLAEGEYTIGPFTFKIIHTPGHSPGGVSILFAKQKWVISGDCIFQNGIGRTDLPGGNQQELIQSIKQKLFALPDDFTLYPGHGPTTTIQAEKTSNPFL